MLADLQRSSQGRPQVRSEFPGVARVRPEVPHSRKDALQVMQEQDCPHAVLDLRLMYLDRHHQTQCVDEEVTLPATDVLATVVSARSAGLGRFDRLTVNDRSPGGRLTTFPLTHPLPKRGVYSLPDALKSS